MLPPPGNLRRFAVLWFCYFAAIGSFNPYAPLWFKELGFSTLAIGTIASLQAWTRVVAPYAWGWLGDHSGHRMRWVHLATWVCVAAAAGLLWARGYGVVAACTVVLFLANGAVVPLSEASLAHQLKTSSDTDAGSYGRVRVWGSVGFIVATLTFGVVLQVAGIGWFPWLLVAMYVLLAVAAGRAPDLRDDVTGHEQVEGILAILRRPEVAWFFASIFFTVLAHTSLYTFFSLYLDSLGYAKSVVGTMWAVSIAVEIAFFGAQGRIFARVPPHRWLQLAAAVSVLRFGVTAAFAAHWPALVVAQLMHVVTFAAQHAACIEMISRHFVGPQRGRGQALYSVLGYGASGVIGGVAGGWISARWGFAAVFWAATLAAAAGWVCAMKSQRAAAA